MLQIKDDVYHTLDDAGNSVELVSDTFDADRSDGKTFQRGEQNAAKCVTDGSCVSRLKRAELETAKGIGSIEHYDLIRFLEC